MIDMKPAIGRIIFGEAVCHDAIVGRSGVIKQVHGQRIIVLWDGESKERHTYKFSAVCDTKEEVEKIVELSDRTEEGIEAARDVQQREWSKLQRGAK